MSFGFKLSAVVFTKTISVQYELYETVSPAGSWNWMS